MPERDRVIMPDNFEVLETGQIEIMHQQVHDRLDADGVEDCDMIRMQHDSLAAELVKRGVMHDTEIVCPEVNTNAPNYRRGFTDDICTNCAFGQLFPFCNLYKFDYTKGYTCDSFRYFEVMELEPPHGFLMMNGKQTAIAQAEKIAIDKPYLIVSGGEVFGTATLSDAVQMKAKEFDREEWLNQHRITPRERRQWWPDASVFFVYPLKDWQVYDSSKVYENGCVVNEPKLTAKQWQIVSKAKELPKQITLIDDAVSVTDQETFIFDDFIDAKSIEHILRATYDLDYVVKEKVIDEAIPIYSLALVRNPRMRVSKKSPETAKKDVIEAEIKQEDETMPFRIRKRDDEYCVVKIEADDSDGDTMGCHETEGEAEAQLTALNINVTAEEESAYTGEDKPRKRKPRKKELPEDQPVIEMPENEGFMAKLKTAAKTLVDIITLAETEENEVETGILTSNYGVMQKEVNGELWHFTWSTNAFEDREGEIFSTKSLERYVEQAEQKSDRGFFNLWHINAEDGNFNTDFAKKEWQGVVGRFLVEAGPYLDNGKGRSAKKFFSEFSEGHPELAPEGWGCSPEFRYLPEERATGIYENIWITRTSTLPKMAAANIWTDTRQLERHKMALSEDQMKAAVAAFGKEEIDNLIVEAEKRTAELEAENVAHKGEGESKTEQPAPEPQQFNIDMEALAAEVGKQFSANLDPFAEAIATMTSGMNELTARVDELEESKKVKAVTESPRFVFNLQRASEADETIVADGDKLKDQKPEETKANNGDSWSQLFNK